MARKQKYPVELSDEDRQTLTKLVKNGQNKVRTLRRAQILLWSDAGKSDSEIAQLLSITPLTVANTRQRWLEKHSLADEARSGRPPVLDGKQEAFLVALTCSEAPEGVEHWSLQLLADKMLELAVVDTQISKDTVGRRLKKTHSSLG